MGFLITGLPRSGTKFLYTNMKKSKTFKVDHDGLVGYVHNFLKTDDKQALHHITKRFNDNTGFISGVFRDKKIFNLINVNKKGVIIRNPIEVFKSRYNFAPKTNFNHLVNTYNTELKHMAYLIEDSNTKNISFSKMVSDKNYLIDIIKFFGMEDVNKEDISLKKVHNTKNDYTFKITKEIETITNQSKWFIDKYKNLF
jgi:hypothetical protein